MSPDCELPALQLPADPAPAGPRWGPVVEQTGQRCDPVKVVYREVPEALWEAAAPLRAVDPRLAFSDWGFVSLPLPTWLTPAQRQLQWEQHGLDTEARRQKGVVALGPGEPPRYAHFLGTDAEGTDHWGHPDALARFVALAEGWAAHCAPLAAAEGLPPGACTIQVGDIATFGDLPGGVSDHLHHRSGRCFDLRLFRRDGAPYEAAWNRPDDRTGAEAYSQALTLAFIRYSFDHESLSEVLFNDPVVRKALPQVKSQGGHDDHLHWCLAPTPRRP